MHTQSIRFLDHTRASNYCEGGAEQSIVIALEVEGGEEDGQTIEGVTQFSILLCTRV